MTEGERDRDRGGRFAYQLWWTNDFDLNDVRDWRTFYDAIAAEVRRESAEREAGLREVLEVLYHIVVRYHVVLSYWLKSGYRQGLGTREQYDAAIETLRRTHERVDAALAPSPGAEEGGQTQAPRDACLDDLGRRHLKREAQP